MPEALNPWLHILAATVWVGPQVFMFVAAGPALHTVEDLKLRTQAVRVLATRFNYLAWGALVVLVITGIGNLFEEDEPIGELFEMNFGAIFAAKMVLVATTVALTALHSFVIGPRLLNLQESVSDEEQIAPTRRLSLIVSTVNLLLAVAILFCAALLHTSFAEE